MPIIIDTLKNSSKLDKQFREAITQGVDKTAEFVLGEAVRRAPKDTSALRQNGQKKPAQQLFTSFKAEIFFDKPYARIQHEENYKHTDGERYYLKNAIEMHKTTLISEVKTKLSGVKL